MEVSHAEKLPAPLVSHPEASWAPTQPSTARPLPRHPARELPVPGQGRAPLGVTPHPHTTLLSLQGPHCPLLPPGPTFLDSSGPPPHLPTPVLPRAPHLIQECGHDPTRSCQILLLPPEVSPPLGSTASPHDRTSSLGPPTPTLPHRSHGSQICQGLCFSPPAASPCSWNTRGAPGHDQPIPMWPGCRPPLQHTS